MKRNLLNLTQAIAAVAVVCVLGVNVDAQTVTTTVVNDSFVDGDPDNNGLPGEVQWFTSSSGAGLDSGPQTAGVLDFASGSSGRSIHALFAPQSLTQVGDKLSATISYTAPASVGVGEDIRFGFFDTSTSPGFSRVDAMGALVNPMGFAADISASSSGPEPGLNIRGFSGGSDINDLGNTGDLEFRTHDYVNGTGRLLTTTGSFFSPTPGTGNTVRNGTDDGTDLIFGFPSVNPAPSTSGTVEFAIELLAGGQVELTESLFGETWTVTGASVADVLLGRDTDGDGVGDSTNFGTGSVFDSIFLSVTSDAFGSSNVVGEADNGLDITNVTVEFTTTSTVPEPGSALALLGLLGVVGMKRRRR